MISNKEINKVIDTLEKKTVSIKTAKAETASKRDEEKNKLEHCLARLKEATETGNFEKYKIIKFECEYTQARIEALEANLQKLNEDSEEKKKELSAAADLIKKEQNTISRNATKEIYEKLQEVEKIIDEYNRIISAGNSALEEYSKALNQQDRSNILFVYLPYNRSGIMGLRRAIYTYKQFYEKSKIAGNDRQDI